MSWILAVIDRLRQIMFWLEWNWTLSIESAWWSRDESAKLKRTSVFGSAATVFQRPLIELLSRIKVEEDTSHSITPSGVLREPPMSSRFSFDSFVRGESRVTYLSVQTAGWGNPLLATILVQCSFCTQSYTRGMCCWGEMASESEGYSTVGIEWCRKGWCLGKSSYDACIPHGSVMDFVVQSDPQNLEHSEAGGTFIIAWKYSRSCCTKPRKLSVGNLCSFKLRKTLQREM